MIKPCKRVKIEKCKPGSKHLLSDTIPVELLLTIHLNGMPVSTISCLPDDLIELVIGYLLNNCYIRHCTDINLLRLCEKQIKNRDLLSMSVMVDASCEQQPDSNSAKGSRFISSGCGSFDDMILHKINELGRLKKTSGISIDTILVLSSQTVKNQEFKNKFGGLHSAALFDWNGKCIRVIEDIGRHNCIDKLAGFMATRKLAPCDKLLFTTGRVSLDTIFKVYMMRIPAIVSNSSITHSAVSLAKKTRITAIGYARGGRFNIYTHPFRIVQATES
jgi:FdhD protein